MTFERTETYLGIDPVTVISAVVALAKLGIELKAKQDQLKAARAQARTQQEIAELDRQIQETEAQIAEVNQKLAKERAKENLQLFTGGGIILAGVIALFIFRKRRR